MADVRAEVLVRDVVGGRFAAGSAWEMVGEVTLARNSARLQMLVRAARDAGKTWLTLDVAPHRYHGKCGGCKRPVTRLLRERVDLGTDHRTGRDVVKRSAVNVEAVGDDATLATCPACRRDVRLTRLKGTYRADVLCDARCTSARGSNCECSCGGANHGSDWG